MCVCKLETLLLCEHLCGADLADEAGNHEIPQIRDLMARGGRAGLRRGTAGAVKAPLSSWCFLAVGRGKAWLDLQADQLAGLYSGDCLFLLPDPLENILHPSNRTLPGLASGKLNWVHCETSCAAIAGQAFVLDIQLQVCRSHCSLAGTRARMAEKLTCPLVTKVTGRKTYASSATVGSGWRTDIDRLPVLGI